MLLREFTVENHIVTLTEENELYIAKITNNKGERLLYNEYKDYKKIKGCFDKIVQAIEIDHIDIREVIGILERSAV
ncbi:MAG: hypothetical protein VB106_06850 [Clostridiaceae bacterium]|jgi:hypothetical protein|nr:hypothetical protein [Clostridiaceae bacterium]